MSEFRKKPVKIEAIQWNGTLEALNQIKELSSESDREIRYHELSNSLFIETLEGSMQAGLSDWVIKGVHGEIYPCKDDIFREIYAACGEDSCIYCKYYFFDNPQCCIDNICNFEWPGENK